MGLAICTSSFIFYVSVWRYLIFLYFRWLESLESLWLLPQKTDQFKAFHHNSFATLTPTVSLPSATAVTSQEDLSDILIGHLLANLQHPNSTPPTPTPTTPVCKPAPLSAIPSSSPDGSEMGFNMYPETDAYMLSLGDINPCWKDALIALGDALVQQDLYNINELEAFNEGLSCYRG